MKTSLVIVGIIFLVIGVLAYFIPMQEVKADTTDTVGGNMYAHMSTAKVTIPYAWSFAATMIGFLLLVLGFVIPNSVQVVKNDTENNLENSSYDKVVESKENIEIGNGNNRKIVKERTETYKTKKNQNVN